MGVGLCLKVGLLEVFEGHRFPGLWLSQRVVARGALLLLQLPLSFTGDSGPISGAQLALWFPSPHPEKGTLKIQIVAPSERDPIPTEIGSLKRVVNSPTNQNGIPLALTHSHLWRENRAFERTGQAVGGEAGPVTAL